MTADERKSKVQNVFCNEQHTTHGLHSVCQRPLKVHLLQVTLRWAAMVLIDSNACIAYKKKLSTLDVVLHLQSSSPAASWCLFVHLGVQSQVKRNKGQSNVSTPTVTGRRCSAAAWTCQEALALNNKCELWGRGLLDALGTKWTVKGFKLQPIWIISGF